MSPGELDELMKNVLVVMSPDLKILLTSPEELGELTSWISPWRVQVSPEELAQIFENSP